MKRNEEILDLRGFLKRLEDVDPSAILRVSDPVDIDFDTTAIAMELENPSRA